MKYNLSPKLIERSRKIKVPNFQIYLSYIFDINWLKGKFKGFLLYSYDLFMKNDRMNIVKYFKILFVIEQGMEIDLFSALPYDNVSFYWTCHQLRNIVSKYANLNFHTKVLKSFESFQNCIICLSTIFEKMNIFMQFQEMVLGNEKMIVIKWYVSY